jgi:hypothetical protein
MAIVQGIREKVHLPIYDSLKIAPEAQLRDVETSGTLKFFVNVQNKTKLETNLQSASLLPHYNTFEARAMRVVISDLPPAFPNDVSQEEKDNDASGPNGQPVNITGNELPPPIAPGTKVQADIDIPLDRLVELLKEAKDSTDDTASVDLDDDMVTLVHVEGSATALTTAQIGTLIDSGVTVDFTTADLQGFLDDFDEKDQPLPQQLDTLNGDGSLIGKIIYNTVTSLYVGEKIMIQVPTWFFPAGAGPYSETASITTHGTPSPQDTFRFAEAIYIDKQQNFRVEIEIPDADVLKELQRIYGPMYVWVVLDGYMTRGVQ